MHRILSIHGDGLPTVMGDPVLVAVRIEGQERLCELFAYDVELHSPDTDAGEDGFTAGLDTLALRGQLMTVGIALDDGATREISGLVTDVRGPFPEDRHHTYRVTLRPWLWLATLTTNYRIFQQQTVVEILEALLAEYNFPVVRRLDDTCYPRRDYQVQYGESDFTFFQRLTQEWGIGWHFEHGNGAHRLVLTDGNGAFVSSPGQRYRVVRWDPSASAQGDEACLHHFEVHDRLVSGAWRSNDYDFVKPDADLAIAHADPLKTAHGQQSLYEWPGDHGQPATGNDPWNEGRQIARIRMEAIRQHGSRVSGRGNLRGLAAGHTFKLAGFAREVANREYLILATTLLIEDAAEVSGSLRRSRCEMSFEGQPSNETFRPDRTQPKPIATGPQTATVVGPQDQETWTDEYGRVRVRFHWDRSGRRNDDGVCWVRVASAWHGSHYGALHVPRIGQEVVVDHLNGDPDCPLISGAVPNRSHPPPWTLPEHHAMSGFVSKELHGDRGNAFVQDDSAGQIQTQVQSDHQASWLGLGFLTRIVRSAGRKDKRGEGFELRTDGHGALRGGRGLLISTEARADGQSHHTDMAEAVARLDHAQHAHRTTADLARRHNAHDTEQQDASDVLRTQQREVAGDRGVDGGSELSAPHLVLASQAGMAVTTATSSHWRAGEHIAVTAGKHVSVATAGGIFASAMQRLALFAHRLGIRLVAATDDIVMEAQGGKIRVTAQQDIHLHAQGSIVLEAGEGILFKVGHTYQHWTPTQIVEGMTGKRIVHADGLNVDAPDSMTPTALTLPRSDFDQEVFLVLPDGSPAKRRAFRIGTADGRTIDGSAMTDGLTRYQQGLRGENFVVQFPEDIP